MKEKLLSLIVSAAFMSPAWAGVEIVTDRAVVGQSDILEARLHFPAPDNGDLYVAVMIQGQLRFYGEDGGFHVEPVPYRRDGVYDEDEVIFKFPGAAVPQGRYTLYSVVTDAGANVFDFQRWHGPVAKQLFIVNEPMESSRDFDGDGWPDDDEDRDGFSEMDKNYDGYRDDDGDHNGIPDDEEHVGGNGENDDAPLPPADGQSSAGDLARGQALYASHCASCHGADPANGRNGIYEGVDPYETREAIAKNKGGMGFLANVLNDADLQSIAAYIRSRLGR